MTKEEKAKAYDEAMRIAKEMYQNKGTDIAIKDYLTSIFPELVESEDERIREGIIKLLDDIANGRPHSNPSASMCQDAIRYLEKQKEQKPVEQNSASGNSENSNNHAEWREEYREEDIQTRFAFYTYKDESDVLYLSNLFVEKGSRNAHFGTRILKGAEKLAEIIGATTIRLKAKQDSPANDWYRKHGYGYVTFEDGYDWLEKKLEYLKPTKREWSEEEKKVLDSIIDDYEKAAKSFCGYEGKIMLLKAIRDGEYDLSKYEWSKEDEKILNELLDHCNTKNATWYNFLKSLRPQPKPRDTYYNIIHSILAMLKDKDFTQITPEHRVSLLNDIRVKCMHADECAEILDEPHWKPTEEQVGALYEVSSYRRHSNPVLWSLYEDLKKLM